MDWLAQLSQIFWFLFTVFVTVLGVCVLISFVSAISPELAAVCCFVVLVLFIIRMIRR